MEDILTPRYTRSTTTGGQHPAPEPLYSPQSRALAFGTVLAWDYGAGTTALADSTAPAVRPTPASAGDLVGASALAAPNFDTNGVEGLSSTLSSLPVGYGDASGEGKRKRKPTPEADDVDHEGWTPVTRKTSQSHHERRSSS